jgi:transcription termination factor Rho
MRLIAAARKEFETIFWRIGRRKHLASLQYPSTAGLDLRVRRRILNPMGTMDAIDFLLDKLRNTKSNDEFFESMNT